MSAAIPKPSASTRNDTRRRVVLLTAALLTAWVATAGCGTPTGDRLADRLGRATGSIREFADRDYLRRAAARLDTLRADGSLLMGLEVKRTREMFRGDVLPDVGQRVRSLAATAGTLWTTTTQRTRAMAGHIDLHSLPRPPREAIRAATSALRRLPHDLGLDRQMLADPSDWERRTDPNDRSQPLGWGPRLLRRLGL